MKKIFLISVLMLLSIAVFGQDAKYNILDVIRNLTTLYDKGNEVNAEWEYHNDVYATNFEHKSNTFYITDRVFQQTSANTATVKWATKPNTDEYIDFQWHKNCYYKVVFTQGETKKIFYIDDKGIISKNKPEDEVCKCTYRKREDGKVIITYGNSPKRRIFIENEECFLSLLHNDLKSLALTYDYTGALGGKTKVRYSDIVWENYYVHYDSSIKNKEKNLYFLNTDECLKLLLDWESTVKKDYLKQCTVYDIAIDALLEKYGLSDKTTKKKKRHSEKIDDLYF